MDACEEWTGARSNRGYGARRIKGKTLAAHRVAWEQANGPIPPGMVIMHLCDNRACVKLSHLQLGTQAENIMDAYQKGRLTTFYERQTHCKRGHEFVRLPNGYRRCKVCERARNAASNARRKAALARPEAPPKAASETAIQTQSPSAEAEGEGVTA